MSNPYSNGRLIRRLLAMTWEYRWSCVKVLFYQIVLLALGMGGLGLTGLGIDFLRHELQPATRPPDWPAGLAPPAAWSALGVVTAIAAAMLLMALARAGLNLAYGLEVADLLEMRVMVKLRAEVYDKLQRLSFRFFDDHASGSIINRVTGDSRSVGNFVNNVLFQSLIMALSLAVYLAYMLSIHVRLTLACLATTPLLWLITASFSRKVRPAYERNRDLSDRLILTLVETVQGIAAVKGFAREKERFDAFQQANRTVREQQQSIFWRVSFFVPSTGFLTQVNLCILLAYGGHLVIRGELPLGAGLIVFAGLLQQFSAQVSNVAQIANTIQQSLTGAQRVFEVLDAPVEIRNSPDARPLPRARGAVTFDRVTFGYKPGEPVLEEISFAVRPGECIGILGPTGSGKTTLLSLIPRFYDASRGTVTVDGCDVRQLHLDDLRRNVGLVFQESFLFSNTIAANIAFGHTAATAAEIESAARIAAAHDFITGMPLGYETLLREGGKDLSGGQRQRLAIARAVLLDPSILLLDDPTAAVDPRTEAEILEAVEHAMKNRTTFIVANRINTLRRADRVLVLEKGRIVQSGRHEELIRVPGAYRSAALLQFGEGTGAS